MAKDRFPAPTCACGKGPCEIVRRKRSRDRDTEKELSSKCGVESGDFQRMKACRRGTRGRRSGQDVLRSGDPGVGARVVWDELPGRQVWAGQAEVGISVGGWGS